MTHSNQPEVLYTLESTGVVSLTLNRPQSYNALSLSFIQALRAEFEKVSQDPSVHVIILQGSGRGFCAGHDLKEIESRRDRVFYETLMKECSELMQLIQSIPQPVIAQVHGVATAAGCQLVAACDLAVAANDAKFATPGVMIGLFCTTPMVAVSRAVSRKHALELLLTGEFITAQEAKQIGLINQSVDLSELPKKTRELAAKIANRSPYVVGLGKKAFYHQIELPVSEAYAYAQKVMVENLLAADAQEGISAFLEKREPHWQGSRS